MKLIVLTLLSVVLLSGCSRKFQKDYEVVDASSKDIPEWLEEAPEKWAEDADESDFKKSRYYSYTSEAKTNRDIACKIAEVKTREKIASEISVYIKNSFAAATEGDPNAKDEKIDEYVSDELAQEVQNQFVGSRVLSTYWEKRRFQKEMGAKTDWAGYTCSALVRIPKTQLKKAFSRANQLLNAKAKTTKTKETVKKAVEKAQTEYLKI